jgi:hypothetical protein
MRLEVLRLYPAEGQEEHREDEERLYNPYRSREQRAEPVQGRNGMV